MANHVVGSVHELKAALTALLTAGNWEMIERRFSDVQLDWREDLKPGWGKPTYVRSVLNGLSGADLMALAARCMDVLPSSEIFDVQNALWMLEADGTRHISSVTRRKLAQAFDGLRMHPHHEPDAFVQRFAPLSKRAFERTYSYSADDELRHRGNVLFALSAIDGAADSVPWHRTNHLQLLEDADFLTWPDQRIVELLECTVHPDARTGTEQDDLIKRFADIVQPDGYVVAKAGRVSGHDVYAFRSRKPTGLGKPKNLVFASTGPKPEIGFRDAVSNDIVLLRHGEHCLVYEEDLAEDGLTWHQLATWWAKQRGQDPADAKVRRALGFRLRKSLQSPAEMKFFDAYFKHVRPSENQAPALLPQVYLHYDPITHKELYRRGEDKRFAVQRMDFLMLLPQNVRVVIEIDGKQHYSEGDRASPRKYAETVAPGRQLQLAGYEVYRFAGYELTEQPLEKSVNAFIDSLFRKHSLRL